MSLPANKDEWNTLLTRAESSDGEAQYNVGLAYHDGLKDENEIIVEQDFGKAFEWFNRSLKAGNLAAIVMVADYLSEGITCERNLKLAIKLYEDAINQGSGSAANNLGCVYRDEGKFEKAFEYYLLSEKLWGVSYSLKVAFCYYYGIGTNEDKSTAIEIFKAISEDNEHCCSGYEIDEANFLLGQMYLNDVGEGRSIDKAREYLKLADSDGDHRSAQKILQIISRFKTKFTSSVR